MCIIDMLRGHSALGALLHVCMCDHVLPCVKTCCHVLQVKAEWAAAFFVMSGKESSLWGGVLRGLCAPGRGVPGELKPAISKGIVLYLEQYLHRNPYNDRLYLGPSWYRYILEVCKFS